MLRKRVCGRDALISAVLAVVVITIGAMTAASAADNSAKLSDLVSAYTGITVTSPNGGENWVAGTKHQIRWNYTGVSGYTKIELLKGGKVNRTISSNWTIGSNGKGLYNWTISSTQAPGKDYKIRVTNKSNPVYNDTSNANFTISAPPKITVTSPNGGEIWQIGKKFQIRWNYTGNPGSYVKIELLKGGKLNRTISSNWSIGSNGKGLYNWTISSTQAPGKDYKIRVTSKSNPVYNDTSNANFTIIPKYRIYGIDLSPYMDGQNPDLGSPISEEQLMTRMQIIAPYTHWIRTFGSTNGLEKAGSIAHNMGLKAAIGAWLSKDLTANEREISNLINASKAGQVDLAIVGSEVLLRGDLSESQLIGYINIVKQKAPGVQVTTADTYGEILSHPAVVSAVDIVFVNYYPYWEGIKVDNAVAAIHGWHQQVKSVAGSKSIYVSETGWPSCGNPIGDAIPSPQNSSFYFLNFVSWARANNVPYFYFEAYDESWKVKNEGPQGACWGVWDKNGSMKAGMQDVFDNKTISDNWSGSSIPGGPGNASIEFTYVPPYGSFENLKGQVWHVKPVDYKAAVYIMVGSGWWTKPYFSTPLTVINPDGTWTCDITTGGSDQYATAIIAYLVPNGYSPPLMSGGSTLPAELEQNSVAKIEATRSP